MLKVANNRVYSKKSIFRRIASWLVALFCFFGVSSSFGQATLTQSGSLNTFGACSGSVSLSQIIKVSGSSLTGPITITAPTGYELSSTALGVYSGTLTITAVAGTVAITDVYVRLSTTAINGATGNVIATSPGATSLSWPTSTAVVGALPTVSNVLGTVGVCSGLTTTLTAQSSAVSPTFRWYDAASGGTLLATTATYTTAALTSTTSYYVEVAEGANNCIASSRFLTNVTIFALPVVTISPSSVNIPTGGNTTLTASGASSYSWSPSTGLSTTNTISVIASPVTTTTYTVSGLVSATGCINTATATVTVLDPGTIGSDQSICVNSTPASLTSTLNASGPAGITYQWQLSTTSISTGFTNIPGATATTYTPASALTTTTYYRRVATAGVLALASNPVTVTVNANPTATASSNSPVCAGGTVSLTSSGGSTYSWTGPNSFSSTSQNPSISNATVAAGGIYTVTVTSASGCSATATSTVTVNALPTATITAGGPTTFCAGGSVVLTASGGTSYVWSNGFTSTTITVVSSGSFTVTASNASGCSTTSGITTVTVNPLPAATIASNSPVCAGGTISLTSTGGATYSWAGPNSFSSTLQNPTITNATVAASGIYTVTVTSASGCSATATSTVTVNALPTATITAGGPTTFCVGGSVVLTASGGTSYVWSNGFTSTTITVVSSGSFTVTASNASGCSTTSGITTVTVNALPTATIGSNGPICAGGTLSLTSSGGATYSWTGPNSFSSTLQNPTIANATVAASGTYTVTVTSVSGCSTTSTSTVTVNALPTATITAGGPTTFCAGGSVTLTASGGTSYLWSTGLANSSISVASSGTYSVTVTNANGCSATASTSVTVNALPTATITAGGPTTFCTGGSVTLTASAGSTYLWSSGQTTSSIVVSTGGTYSVTVTNASNCSAKSAATVVTVNTFDALTNNASTINICSGSILNFTPSSTLTGSNYTWSRPAVTNINSASGSSSAGTGGINETLTNLSNSPITFQYTYTILSANGCTTNNQNVTVQVNPTPGITNNTTPAAVCSGSAFAFTAVPTVAGTTYAWTRPQVTGISNNANSGSTASISENLVNTTTSAIQVPYTYIITANGCSSSVIVTATINPVPSITNQTTTICNNSTFSITPTNVPTGTTYSWVTPTVSPALSITGGSAQAAQSSIGVNQTLLNTTTNSATATYTVTPLSGSCTGSAFTVAVVVNPNLVLNSATSAPAICSNTVFSYTPSSAVSGTTFAWTRATVTGISNSAGSGTGNPNETLINTTSAPVTVTYTYTLTSGAGCINTQNVTVSVTPAPTLSSNPLPSAVCSGTTFNYTATSATTGTTFAWTRLAVTGISNAVGSGTTSISEALVNTGTTAVSVPYTYVLTANGCSNTQVVTVSVNPTPSVSNQSTTICNNTAFTIAPTNVPIGTTYSWGTPTYSPLLSIAGGSAQAGQNSISQTLVNSTTNNATATYVVTPLAGTCTGSNFNVSVIVNPSLVLSSSTSPAAICSNAVFSYTPTSATAGTSFAWTRVSVTGISNVPANGTGNPNETLINTTAQAVSVPYTFTLTSLNGCVSSQTVTVQVNPSPTLSSLSNPAAVCSGSTFTYLATSTTTGTSFSWTRAQLASISNAAGSGNNATINEALINTGTAAVSVPYVYTLTANGCSNTQTVTATINPTPVVSNQTAAICSGSSFTIAPVNVPSTTTYTWTSPVISPLGSVTGGSALAGQTSISQVLNNITNANGTATYTVTPLAGSCTGTTFTIAVTVNPIPALTSTLTPTAICSNTTFNYTPASNTTGSILGWTRAAVTGISNAAATGLNNPAETLINTTSQPISVPYLYTITTPNGCSATQTVTVVVNPSASLTSGLTPNAICSGSIFSYIPTSATSGTTYSWVRSAVPSISNAAAAGNGNVSETLVNTSILPVDVLYTFTSKANGCNNVQVVTVTVNPTPVSSNLTTTTCSNSAFTVTPSNVPAGTQYTWATPTYNPASSITGGSLQTIAQSSISQTLTNQTVNNAFATYTVTPSANGCTGNSFSLVVTVNPSPVIANQIIAPVCSGTAFTYAATGVPSATTYTWSNPVLSPLNGLTGANAQAVNQSTISQILSSTNNISDTAVYTVTPVAGNGCIGNTFTLSVPVNPVPVINNLTDTICSGATFSVTPSPVPVNTTYTWTTPTTIPTGIVVGGKSQTVATPSISQTLTNSSTTSAAQAIYTITPSSAGCKGASFTLVETVGVPLANISNKIATICSGTAFDVTPVAPANTKYTWTIPTINPAGSVAGTSAASLQTKVSQTISNLGAVKSTVVYTVQPSNTGCIGNSFTATITVLPVPKATITGSTSVCYYPLDTLSVNFVGTAPWSFSYTDNNVPFTVTGITSSPYQLLLPALPGVTTRTVAITLAKDATCIDSINNSTIVQTVNPLPTGQIISLHGPYMCNGIPDTMFVKYPATDTLSFLWTLNGVSVPGVTTDSVATLTTGRYNVIMTNQFGCVDTTANPVTLTLIPPPVTNFSYSSYCINNLINFTNLTDTTFTGPVSWLWDMGDGTTTTTFNAADIYTSGGARRVRLTATPFYCPAYSVTKDSIIDIQYPIPAVRLPSVSAYQSVPTPISARILPGYSYLWTPSKGIDKPDSAQVNFNNQFTQDYVINLISPAGCVTYDSVLVRVFDNNLVNIMVPKSFTPNGDGNNDVLFPYLAGVKTFKYFKVYNRYGKLMFETTNPDAGWNGYFNGAPQPMGIYIWIAVGIANDGSPVEKKGETLLLR